MSAGNCFDEEPMYEGYLCECGGAITEHKGVWGCDSCDWINDVTRRT